MKLTRFSLALLLAPLLFSVGLVIYQFSFEKTILERKNAKNGIHEYDTIGISIGYPKYYDENVDRYICKYGKEGRLEYCGFSEKAKQVIWYLVIFLIIGYVFLPLFILASPYLHLPLFFIFVLLVILRFRHIQKPIKL